MKRFGVWALVVLIAIMDVGFVRPGFAQSEDDLPVPVPISGASGRSVRANVWMALWTWTAPATGSVTFDTRGSDFDTLLFVFDVVTNDLIASSFTGGGVHFTAQQGRMYRIDALRADSYETGTIVLNWQQSSPGSPGSGTGGSQAGADDFADRVALSGASGRREASNANASKESREPDHANDSGGASVWWTWTAPATGPATFDTSGSDFDTLLAVYTGSSVSGLTEVASNDDSGGYDWSGVRFNAQQGRAYHIAVDGWNGDTGAIVLNWQAASPGGDTGGGSQASADDFAARVALSGASGKREGTNVGAGIETGEPRHSGDDGGASVWWTWTAPATGIITFDTLGSDFDTLLAVYTGASLKRLVEVGSNDDASKTVTDDASKTTYQSAVRFNAQRGKAYHVAVDGYGGATGAIVLNWQSASGNGADAFRSSGALTGASGRRDGSNVGAGLETGEPNHASKSGGASVWWTWTAPATGEVTFDTRGSSFDTLLAVYTGTHLNRLTPVASNDDASSGGRQSTVSFRAQRGQTYHIAVDGYGGATGAIVLNWGGQASAGSGPANPLREQVFDNPGPGKPNYVLAGDNAGLQYWFTPGGDVSQSLYEKADGTERVRTFYDSATGAPRTVLNEISGHWLSIRAMGPDRVDFWTYNGAGSYLGGFAVYAKSGQYYTGRITGVPAHEGNPITGQLAAAGASWTGSFTLTGDVEDGLTNIRVAPPELATMIDGLSASGSVVSGAASDDQIYGLSADRPTVIVASSGSGLSLHKALTVAGSIVAAAGLVTITAGGAPIFVAGAAAYVAAQALPTIANGIRRDFGGSCPAASSFFGGLCNGLTNMAADFLASKDARGPVEYVRDAMAWIKGTPSHLRDKVNRGKQKLENVTPGLLPGDAVGTLDNSEPASLIGPPAVGGTLAGHVTGPQGNQTHVTGSIQSHGAFNVSGVHALGGNVWLAGSYNNGALGATTGMHRGTPVNNALPTNIPQPPTTTPQPPDQPQEFPLGTPYVLCQYDYLRSDTSRYGYTRTFNGFTIRDGYIWGSVTSTYNYDGEVETLEYKAGCTVCKPDGYLGHCAGVKDPDYTCSVKCSEYQEKVDAYWGSLYELPVPTKRFTCAQAVNHVRYLDGGLCQTQ